MKVEITSIRNCNFRFKCKQNWHEMSLTRDDGTVRFCSECMQEVFFCSSDSELGEHIKSNYCIAIKQMIRGKESLLLGEVIDSNP